MSKTIREHFEGLPEPYRSQAKKIAEDLLEYAALNYKLKVTPAGEVTWHEDESAWYDSEGLIENYLQLEDSELSGSLPLEPIQGEESEQTEAKPIAEGIKPGYKVVPLQKTADEYSNLNWSSCWNRAQEKKQPFLYYIGTDEENGYCVLSENYPDTDGDFFNIGDFKVYEPASTPQPEGKEPKQSAEQWIKENYAYVDFHDPKKPNYILNVMQLYGDYRAASHVGKMVGEADTSEGNKETP